MLRNSLRKGRLAHTFLFVGPAGIGKRKFAQAVAQCLLCERHAETELLACGVCSGCKQVRAESHPDFLVVSCPEGKSEIPIDVLLGPKEKRGKAGLCFELSLRPMAGGRKIALIDDADRLNDEGANALLKTLEEPPPHSLLILIASSVDSVLPTIRSRSQVLRFSPLTTEQVRELLLRHELTENPAEAAEVALLSEGSLLIANQLLSSELRELRKVLYDHLAARPLQSPQLAARILEGMGAGETSDQRQFAHWMIRFCIEFYRQTLRQLAGDSSESSAGIPQSQAFAARLVADDPDDLEVVVELLDRCIEADRQIDGNAAVSLCLETLFDDLGRLSRSRTAV